jgi:hypothetical protein
MPSNPLHRADTVDLENSVPQSSSTTALTFLVDTPFTTISIIASNGTCSLRWYRAKISVEKCPLRSRGTCSPSSPNTGLEQLLPVPVAVALPSFGTFVGLGLQLLSGLGIEYLVQYVLNQPGQAAIPDKQPLQEITVYGNEPVAKLPHLIKPTKIHRTYVRHCRKHHSQEYKSLLRWLAPLTDCPYQLPDVVGYSRAGLEPACHLYLASCPV